MEKQFEDLEIFDYVPGYNNYKVSSKGRVWSIKNQKYMKTPKDKDGYYKLELRRDKQRKEFKIHRLVAMTFYFYDDYEAPQVDHIDRDKTNNNLLNLRFCSRAQNQRNRGLTKSNTSGYKGVCWSKNMNKWMATIYLNRQPKHLGYFDTKEDAYEAYKKASQELHGDYGYAP